MEAKIVIFGRESRKVANIPEIVHLPKKIENSISLVGITWGIYEYPPFVLIRGRYIFSFGGQILV